MEVDDPFEASLNRHTRSVVSRLHCSTYEQQSMQSGDSISPTQLWENSHGSGTWAGTGEQGVYVHPSTFSVQGEISHGPLRTTNYFTSDGTEITGYGMDVGAKSDFQQSASWYG